MVMQSTEDSQLCWVWDFWHGGVRSLANPTTGAILTNEALNMCSKVRMSILSLPFNIVPEVLFRTIKSQKETKDTQIGKNKIKLSLFSNEIVFFYLENPKELTLKK
jgi:hypothetical protein